MKKHILFPLISAAFTVAMIQSVLYVRAGAWTSKTATGSSEKLARLSDQVSVRAAGRGYPWINLQDGRDLLSERAGSDGLSALQYHTAPLALASADFDEDGTPDLVTSHGVGQGGLLTFYRGNPDAIYPNSAEAKKRKAAGSFTDAPFLSPGRLLAAAEPPDFLGAGDFDADGHWDLVTAARGASSIRVLLGNGEGSFPLSRQVAVPGRVTALITGEINRANGLADIVVAVSAQEGARVLVFESAAGAINAAPESVALPSEAADFALGDFVDDSAIDLAIVAGNELFVATGRDRLVSTRSVASKKPRAQITRRQLSFRVKAVATGNFTGKNRCELGLLSSQGEVLALTPGKAKPNRSRKKSLDNWKTEKLSKQQWPQATRLVRARVSSLPVDNLLVIDPSTSQVHIVTGGAKARQLALEDVSMDVEGEPVAALAMRLNPDALTDLVILRSGQPNPTFITTAPVSTFTVDNPGDSGTGTLRQAIIDANNSGGADEIKFMANTGPQTINLASALPEILEAVLIDGTSQPGFVANPIIQLNGNGMTFDGLGISAGNSTVRGLSIDSFSGNGISLRTAGGNIIEGNFIGLNMSGTGGAGVSGAGVFSKSTGNTIGGTVPSARNVISLTGAAGVDIIDLDVVQGNFIGTDFTGNVALGGFNIGVVANGTGAMIGGAQSGAGNVISAQSLDGIRILSDLSDVIVQSNLIGTNASGTAALGNLNNGITMDNGG
ncbi:MAG TPA: hypothetical protein VNO14_18670, partial [Blastocatellia bacterium]|nr:hypothetical protein [Blastocatellia bacterium]